MVVAVLAGCLAAAPPEAPAPPVEAPGVDTAAPAPAAPLVEPLSVDALLDDVLDQTGLTVDGTALYPQMIAACTDLEHAAKRGRCASEDTFVCFFVISAGLDPEPTPEEMAATAERYRNIRPREFDPRRESEDETCGGVAFGRATHRTTSVDGAITTVTYTARTAAGEIAPIHLLAQNTDPRPTLTGVDFDELSRTAWLGASARGSLKLLQLRRRIRSAPTLSDLTELSHADFGAYQEEVRAGAAVLRARSSLLPAALQVSAPGIEGTGADARLAVWVQNTSTRVIASGAALLWITIDREKIPVRQWKSCKDTTAVLTFSQALLPGARLRVSLPVPVELTVAAKDSAPGNHMSLRAAPGFIDFGEGEVWDSPEYIDSMAGCW